jgi:hypothetical protein
MLKQQNNRKEDRQNIQILSYIVEADGREVTAREIADAVRSGAITQTNHWLGKLRNDIISGKGYTKNYGFREVKNPITGLPMYVYFSKK